MTSRIFSLSRRSAHPVQCALLAYQTPFFFWPTLENFGIYSSYAYVDSDVKEFVPVTNPLTGAGFGTDSCSAVSGASIRTLPFSWATLTRKPSTSTRTAPQST